MAMTMQSGGYDYEFVHTPSDTLICQICHSPSKKPHLSECCGHTFCKSCLEAAKGVKFVTSACPICRSEEFVTFHNKQADRTIRSLHVYCSNKKKGCEWQGEVNDITSHLNNRDGCQFQEVNCPSDCGVAYQRQYLTGHVEIECPRRKVNCQYCHGTGEHQFIEGQHKEVCPKLPLPCPNKCGVDNIPRDGLSEHSNLCPLQPIQCKYHIVGCEAIMACKDQEKHNKEMMEEHLSLSISKLMQISASQHDAQRITHDLTQKVSTAEKEIVSLKLALTDNGDEVARKREIKFQSEKSAEENRIVLQEATTAEENLAQDVIAAQRNSKNRSQEFEKELPEEKIEKHQNKARIYEGQPELLTSAEAKFTAPIELVSISQCKGAGTLGELIRNFIQNVASVEDDVTSFSEEIEKNQAELKVVKQELQALKITATVTKEQLHTGQKKITYNLFNGLMSGLIVALMFSLYFQYNKMQSLETELKTKVNEIEMLDKITEMKNWVTQDLLSELQRLEKDNNATKLHVIDLTQQLFVAEEENAKLKQQLVTLSDNTDTVLAKADMKFQSKIATFEIATQKSITELQQSFNMIWRIYLDGEAIPVVVKMSGFTEKKKQDIQWFSEPFYTHSNGYKMQLGVFPNGDGRNTVDDIYMTVSLYVMKGLYDGELEWPLKGKCEVKLLNQKITTATIQHHSVTHSFIAYNSGRAYSERNDFPAWYAGTFISNEAFIATNDFLHNDTIYFQVCKPSHE